MFEVFATFKEFMKDFAFLVMNSNLKDFEEVRIEKIVNFDAICSRSHTNNHHLGQIPLNYLDLLDLFRSYLFNLNYLALIMKLKNLVAFAYI